MFSSSLHVSSHHHHRRSINQTAQALEVRLFLFVPFAVRPFFGPLRVFTNKNKQNKNKTNQKKIVYDKRESEGGRKKKTTTTAG